MPGGSSPRRKGNLFEREVVKACVAAGVEAERAWGSDGRSMGHAPGVDLVIDGFTIQAKRVARVAKWLKPPPGCDFVVTREDRGETYAVIPLSLLLRLNR